MMSVHRGIRLVCAISRHSLFAVALLAPVLTGTGATAQPECEKERPGTTALVLGGGSLKGAYQAGVIQAVLGRGFQPNNIYGISVGALNAAYLVSLAGATADGTPIDWEKIGKRLADFWKQKILLPRNVRIEHNLVFNPLEPDTPAAFNASLEFFGLNSPTPLRKLVKNEIKSDQIKRVHSKVKLQIGAVDIDKGVLIYRDGNSSDLHEFVMASAALPVIFPVVSSGNARFVDGGVRNVVPLRKAICDGMQKILVIALQPENDRYKPIKIRHISELLLRTIDIMGSEIIKNNLEHAKGKAVQVVRPSEPIDLDMDKFNSAQIHDLWKRGYEDGTKASLP
jgi:NTE family protein